MTTKWPEGQLRWRLLGYKESSTLSLVASNAATVVSLGHPFSFLLLPALWATSQHPPRDPAATNCHNKKWSPTDLDVVSWSLFQDGKSDALRFGQPSHVLEKREERERMKLLIKQPSETRYASIVMRQIFHTFIVHPRFVMKELLAQNSLTVLLVDHSLLSTGHAKFNVLSDKETREDISNSFYVFASESDFFLQGLRRFTISCDWSRLKWIEVDNDDDGLHLHYN